MQEVKSVLDFGGGAIFERINRELKEVIDNIRSTDTDDKARTLTIKMSIKPLNNRTQLAIQTTVNKSLRPTQPVDTQVFMQEVAGRIQAFENDGLMDGQKNIFGEIHQTKYIELGDKPQEVNVNE